ncbi:MAG: hypothetical protein ACREJ2_16400 [Planctomycetota bacterium]
MNNRDQYVEKEISQLEAAINQRLAQFGIDSLAVLGMEEDWNALLTHLRASLRNLYEQGWKTGIAEHKQVEVTKN